MSLRRAARALAVASLLACGVATPVAGTWQPAAAASIHPAATGSSPAATSAKVKRLLARIATLSHEVKAAEKQYADALGSVASGVTSAITADRDRGAVTALVRASRQRLETQVVGLYAAGGDLATTASLFSPPGLTGYEQGTDAISAAVSETLATARAQQAAVTAAAHRQASVTRHAAAAITVESSVAVVARRVTGLLSQEQALLTAARKQLAAAQQSSAQLSSVETSYSTQSAQFANDTAVGVNSMGILPPSPAFLAMYKAAAATCPGLPWTVLAAIGQNESGHGRNDGPSSAGALGPMQFMPDTFRYYATDGDHDGVANIMDPADSIFTAAHMLCENGAKRGTPAGLHAAIFDYDHAEWYVTLVLGLAAKYQAAYGA